MIAPLIRSGQGVTVIGGGAVQGGELRAALAAAPLLVAADSGADQALDLGHRPDWVIGDMDSIGAAARRAMPAGRVIKVAEQDSTDFAKCLSRIDAPFVIAVGFAGLRLDHTLAALTTMVQDGYPPVILLASNDIVFLSPPRITLPLTTGTRVSLYPMGPASGESRGLKWPIDGIDFAPQGRVGTSNEAAGPVTLHIRGKMLVMLPQDCLDVALHALTN